MLSDNNLNATSADDALYSPSPLTGFSLATFISGILLFVLLVILLVWAVWDRQRQKVKSKRWYKIKDREFYFDQETQRLTFTKPSPTWTISRDFKPSLRGVEAVPPTFKTPCFKSSFASGVPTVVLSHVASCPRISKDAILPHFNQEMASLKLKFQDVAAWFIEKESLLIQQHTGQPRVHGSLYGKVFSESIIDLSDSTLALAADHLALEHVLVSAVQKHIFSQLASCQSHVQSLAAFLASVKSLPVPRSIISLMDCEVYAHVNTFLSQHGRASVDRTVFATTHHPLADALDKAKADILGTLSLILPMTLTETTSDTESIDTLCENTITDERLIQVIFDSLVAFFKIMSMDPLLSFKWPQQQDRLEWDWMQVHHDIMAAPRFSDRIQGAVWPAVCGRHETFLAKASII